MPRYRITWGIKGSAFNHDEIIVPNEDEAWSEARDRALEMVGYSAERIDGAEIVQGFFSVPDLQEFLNCLGVEKTEEEIVRAIKQAGEKLC